MTVLSPKWDIYQKKTKMGKILDILNTIADRISEIKKELKILREEMRIPKGAISIEGLQRLIAHETPEYYELIMALVGLQVAIEHGTETEIFHARNCLTSMLKNQKYSPCFGKYRIDKDRHTDIAKILSSMYEDRIFVTDDGFWASNKKEVMQQFGIAFRCNLSDYSTLISNSKSKSKNYLAIFDKLKQHAQKYIDA